MAKQLNIKEHAPKKESTQPYQSIIPPDLDEIHRKNGYYDGSIFFSQDRATYTCLDDDEVIILHLDINRSCLYLNGHKITALDTHENLALFLASFRKNLVANKQTKDLVSAFDSIVSTFKATE